MAITFDIITEPAGFQRLQTPWNDLCQRSPVDHAFMRHEWFSCWIRHLMIGGGRMWFVVGRDGDDLVLAAPMLITREKLRGVPARIMRFAASTITPRCNFLGETEAPWTELFEFITGHAPADLILTNGMGESAAPTALWRRYLDESRSHKLVVEEGRKSPYLTCRGEWSEFFGGLSKSFRRNLRYYVRELEKHGSWEVDRLTTYAEFKQYLPQLIEVSARSWKGEEGTDLRSLPQVVDFLDDFSRLGEADGLWEIWVLTIDKRPIAFHYYLRGTDAISAIRTDFDLAFKTYSPGNVLQQEILRHLFGRDETWECDMGGQSYEYKLKWTEQIRSHVDVWTAGSGFYGRLLMVGKARLLPLLSRD